MCRVENVLKRRKRRFARHARTYFSCVVVSNTYITNNIEYCITGTPHNHRTIADTTVRITVIGTSHFYCPSSVHLMSDDTLKLHTHTGMQTTMQITMPRQYVTWTKWNTVKTWINSRAQTRHQKTSRVGLSARQKGQWVPLYHKFLCTSILIFQCDDDAALHNYLYSYIYIYHPQTQLLLIIHNK